MKKWKIYSLLFGLVLSFSTFTIFSHQANAVESYKISPAQDRSFRQLFHRSRDIPDHLSIDVHYYFYTYNGYDENLQLIAYTCDYTDDYTSLKKIDNCGLFLEMEGGKFKIKLRSATYVQTYYSRRTLLADVPTYSSTGVHPSYSSDYKNEIVSISDDHFEKGFTLLGGTTPKVNNWNREEGGFLVEPAGGSSGGSTSQNNQGGGFNLDFGGFIKGILDGISEFFEPMRQSLSATERWLNNSLFPEILKIPEHLINLGKTISEHLINLGKTISENFINLGKTISEHFINLVKMLADFIINIPKIIADFIINIPKIIADFIINLSKMLADFVVSLFTIQPDFIDNKTKDFQSRLSSKLGPIGDVFSNMITFFSIFVSHGVNGLECSHSSIVVVQDTMGINFDLCHVPRPMLILARSLLVLAIMYVVYYRFMRFLNILFGSKYIWTMGDGDDDGKDTK